MAVHGKRSLSHLYRSYQKQGHVFSIVQKVTPTLHTILPIFPEQNTSNREYFRPMQRKFLDAFVIAVTYPMIHVCSGRRSVQLIVVQHSSARTLDSDTGIALVKWYLENKKTLFIVTVKYWTVYLLLLSLWIQLTAWILVYIISFCVGMPQSLVNGL